MALAEDAEDSNWIAKINAILSAHYKIDPKLLDDQQWALLFNQYKYTKQVEGEQFKRHLLEAFSEAIKAVYGNS